MTKKLFYTISSLLLIVFLSGCSLFPSAPKGKSGGGGGNGVYKSEDKGIGWLAANNIKDSINKIDRLNVRKISSDIRDSRIMYIGTNDGLYLSEDAAGSWQVIQAGVSIADFALNPKTRGLIYTVAGSQVYKTTDDGKNWSLIYTETKPKVVITSVIVSHFDTSRVYVLNSSGSLMRSNDWGESWKLMYDFKVRTSKLYMNPKNSTLMYVRADNGLYRTRDEGSTWEKIMVGQNQYFPGSENHKDLFFHKSSNVLFHLSNFGILKSSDDGESWQDIKLISPAGSVDIGTLGINPKDSREIYYTVNNILYHTIDGGLNWKTKVLPSGSLKINQMLIDFYDPGNIYIGIGQ